MRIISKFVREQKRYTKSDLKQIFNLSSDELGSFIRKLKAFGVLKNVKNNYEQMEMSDLIDEDIEVADVDSENNDYFYVFTYVGVITIGSRIIKCYPKYLPEEIEPINEMKQILKVISSYGSKEQIINLYNGSEENSTFNILAVILFLLNDYHDYGIYNNTEDIIEINGEGEILWGRTISDSFPIISNNRPYYLELYTGKTIDNEFDFFRRLHECVLTECSKQLESSDLLDLFEIVAVNLSEDLLEDFGDFDYILYRIQSELNIQYNTRKQILLKTLYTYIAHNRTMEAGYGISMYGTNNFNLIWEDVCAEVFSNNLQSPLGQLDLPTPLAYRYESYDKLIDIIKVPVWTGFKQDGGVFNKPAKETLIPDIITISRQEGIYKFYILDAKYYNILLEEEKQLRGQPGVGDITKQYLYQLAYKAFLTDYRISEVRNCFLVPTSSNCIVNRGVVKMDFLSSLGLSDIQICQLPAKTMYDCYLSRRTLNVTFLDL